MTPELKPCPFCAVTPEVVRGRIYAKHSWFCILYPRIVHDFEQPKWNTRPIEDELRAKLKIAVDALEALALTWDIRSPKYDPSLEGDIVKCAMERIGKV